MSKKRVALVDSRRCIPEKETRKRRIFVSKKWRAVNAQPVNATGILTWKNDASVIPVDRRNTAANKDRWTDGPMDRWTDGPMWTRGPMDCWRQVLSCCWSLDELLLGEWCSKVERARLLRALALANESLKENLQRGWRLTPYVVPWTLNESKRVGRGEDNQYAERIRQNYRHPLHCKLANRFTWSDLNSIQLHVSLLEELIQKSWQSS